MKTDIQIAQECKKRKIQSIATKINISKRYLEFYGEHKAKIKLELLDDLKDSPNGKLILVTAINPTKAGEGKTTTTVGLGDALSKIGQKTIIALREPSLGPVFGLKGGAAGGGYAQVVPMEDINLHFTGDMHAITTANNLISACLDNHIHHGNELQIDLSNIVWKRALDMNDRALRNVTIAQGKNDGVERKDGFVITVASEIMAILCLSSDLEDFKTRVDRCILAYSIHGNPIFVKDLKITGALAVIMKDAIKPNLVQTLEKTPVLIHGGPFANIAHGCNSIIATKMALKLGDYVVTEAGFGADLGAEKFLNIKCRTGNLQPSMVVIVATIRALKMHGGMSKDMLATKNISSLMKGIENLAKHVENIQKFNLPYVIAINKFQSDDIEEIKCLNQWCQDHHHPVFSSDVFAKGSNGGLELAKYIVENTQEPNDFQYLYRKDLPLEDKILTISREIYGAVGVEYSEQAKIDLALIKKLGGDSLLVCMAKTPNSLSDNDALLGRPKDFKIHIKEMRISSGAGFVVVLTGAIMTMPGLPKMPSAEKIDILPSGEILGLF